MYLVERCLEVQIQTYNSFFIYLGDRDATMFSE